MVATVYSNYYSGKENKGSDKEMTYYKSKRIIDGKPPIWVIVEETGKAVNNNPSEEELKGLEREQKENYKINRKKIYTEEKLKNELRRYEREEGKIPTKEDIDHNPGYPSSTIYVKRFKSWSNALKSVEMDVESMVKKGVIETVEQKRRFAEMIIRDHFERNPTDLAGENKNSFCDGICPNGKTYDVKSSGLHFDRGSLYYRFYTNNKYKEEIEIYYLLAFNDEDYTKLDYGWRIPGEIVETCDFRVGISSGYIFNVKGMKHYDITDKLREVLNKYEFFNKK